MIPNEPSYLSEWVEYHIIVGIEYFYLDGNNSTDGTRQVLCSYLMPGLVNYIVWPDREVQLSVYQFALRALRPISFWVAFIDCDECLVPIATKSVSILLRSFEGDGGLTISWLVYGSREDESDHGTCY
jgi:hypothetical protein